MKKTKNLYGKRIVKLRKGEFIECTCNDPEISDIIWEQNSYAYKVSCVCGKAHYVTNTGRKVDRKEDV